LDYSYRGAKDGKETLYIITARRANPKEREAYASWADRFFGSSGLD
jgi:uncharacterized DUF497 family protein